MDVDACEEVTDEFGITALPSFVLAERISDKGTGLSSSHLLNTFIGKNSPVLIKNEAQKTLSELKKREQEVEKEIKALSDNAASKIVGLEEQSKQKLKDQIEKRKILAENKIDQLVRDANVSIKNYITSTAINTAIHILNNNLTDEKKSSLISESIKC